MNKKLRRLPDWIEDIRGAIKNIREDIKGLTKGQFLDDGKSQRAVAKSVSGGRQEQASMIFGCGSDDVKKADIPGPLEIVEVCRAPDQCKTVFCD